MGLGQLPSFCYILLYKEKYYIMDTEKIKLVVINEHTLGYLIPNSDYAGVLHTSILRGSTYNKRNNVFVKGQNVRLASAKDFEDYRVSFKGFNNPKEFEFQS